MSSGRGSRLTVTVFTDWLNAVMNILVVAYLPSCFPFMLGPLTLTSFDFGFDFVVERALQAARNHLGADQLISSSLPAELLLMRLS